MDRSSALIQHALEHMHVFTETSIADEILHGGSELSSKTSASSSSSTNVDDRPEADDDDDYYDDGRQPQETSQDFVQEPKQKTEPPLFEKYVRVIGADEVGAGPWAGNVVAAAACIRTNETISFLKTWGLRDSKKMTHHLRGSVTYWMLQHPSEVALSIMAFSATEIDHVKNIKKSRLEAISRAALALRNHLEHEDLHPHWLLDSTCLVASPEWDQHHLPRRWPQEIASAWNAHVSTSDRGVVGHPHLLLMMFDFIGPIRMDYHIRVDGPDIPIGLSSVRSYYDTIVAIPKGDDKEPAISAASVHAKVLRDHYMEEQAQIYPGYGFETNRGYGTDEHKKGLEEKGPTPIHRMHFKPLRSLVETGSCGNQRSHARATDGRPKKRKRKNQNE
jgi:ribonuclease HII